MVFLTNGQVLRARLVEAGGKGIVLADIFKTRKEAGVIHHNGTYASYRKIIDILKRLRWIAPTGEKEPSHAKGNSYELKQPRIYYRITNEGLSTSEEDWSNPRTLLYHPDKYRRGKRGRPRFADKQRF